MVLETQFYDILAVPSGASSEEISRAYKKQALKCHPDKTNHNKQLTEKFKDITHAYEVLRDSKLRSVYDNYGKAGLDGSIPPQKPNQSSTSQCFTTSSHNFASATNVFSQVFNDINNLFSRDPGVDFGFLNVRNIGVNMDMNNMKKHVQPAGSPLDHEYRRGQDIHHTCNVGLADMYFGKTIKLQLPKNSKCSKCLGIGGFNPKSCRQCQGLGQVIITYYNQFSQYQQLGRCSPCNGTGTFFSPQDKCLQCNSGYLKEKKIIKVNLLPGSNNGDKIILQGEADEGRNIIPGDVIIHMNQTPHPYLVRKFDDLYMEHEIDLKTALLGGEITIPHFLKDQNTLKIYVNVHGHRDLNDADNTNIQFGEVVGTIQPDKPKIVKGVGMPINEMVIGGEVVQVLDEVDEVKEVSFDLNRYKRGNLFINFKVRLPNLEDFKNGKQDLLALLHILPSRKEETSGSILQTHLSNIPTYTQRSSPEKATNPDLSSEFNYEDIDINGSVEGDEKEEESFYTKEWTGSEAKRRKPNDLGH